MLLALVMACGLSIQAAILGNGVLKAKTQAVKEKVINLRIVNMQQQKVRIALTDVTEDLTFYKKHVKNHNGFAENLDLQSLPEGRYMITVTTKDQKWQQVIRVAQEKVFFSPFRQS